MAGLGFAPRAAPTGLLGREFAHLTIYIPALALFLVVLPRIYGFSTLGRLTDMALFAAPFVLATSLMGQAAGGFFRHRETAVLVFVATTLPQFFLVGVSWPREMIPPPLDHIRRVFPSESAIDGLVRINQMGASLSEVRADWVYCDLFLHCAGRSATADFARCHSLDPTPSNVPTIAVLVAPAAAAGILLFLILGSGVTAARPGRRPDHRNQDRAGDQRPPGSLLGHPRAERASRRRPRRARQPRARRGRLRLAQDLDEATAAVGTAPAKLAAAEETYQAAHLGPTREELAIIDAKVTNAETTVAVIAARAAKLRIRAPADGIVARLVAEPGEAIIPGQPVMTLEATGRRWARFNLREDQLDGLRIGSPAELPPVGGSDPSAARVTEIIARGEFATWRAPRVVGDYDLNTFLVRVDPVPTAGVLQPGMSVWLQPTRPAE